MTNRAIKHPPLVPAAIPDDGDYCALDLLWTAVRKGRRGRHFIRWIHQHIVLFSFQPKTTNSLNNRIVGLTNRDVVVDVILARLRIIERSSWMR